MDNKKLVDAVAKIWEECKQRENSELGPRTAEGELYGIKIKQETEMTAKGKGNDKIQVMLSFESGKATYSTDTTEQMIRILQAHYIVPYTMF